MSISVLVQAQARIIVLCVMSPVFTQSSMFTLLSSMCCFQPAKTKKKKNLCLSKSVFSCFCVVFVAFGSLEVCS